jgi:hypothetical protein
MTCAAWVSHEIGGNSGLILCCRHHRGDWQIAGPDAVSRTLKHVKSPEPVDPRDETVAVGALDESTGVAGASRQLSQKRGRCRYRRWCAGRSRASWFLRWSRAGVCRPGCSRESQIAKVDNRPPMQSGCATASAAARARFSASGPEHRSGMCWCSPPGVVTLTVYSRVCGSNVTHATAWFRCRQAMNGPDIALTSPSRPRTTVPNPDRDGSSLQPPRYNDDRDDQIAPRFTVAVRALHASCLHRGNSVLGAIFHLIGRSRSGPFIYRPAPTNDHDCSPLQRFREYKGASDDGVDAGCR